MTATPVTVIGVGSGLNPEAQQLIEKAGVLVGGARQLRRFESQVAERIVIGADVASSMAAIRGALARKQRIVVLASGDPLLYGIGATLSRELGPECVKVIPSVSSVQLAFACVQEAWHDAAILSAHGRALAGVIPPALGAAKMAILTDGDSTPAAVAAALTEAGMEDCRAVVCERLGCADERITETTLFSLANQQFDPLNVLLLFRRPDAVRLRFGQPDGEFESVRGQITKAEVRAVALSKLKLAPNGVLWDIGAGSGALAIEAARLTPRGAVYAIERDAEQIGCLQRNIARHGATNVHVVHGEAPEALVDLPRPQSVFIGGSGGRLAKLLEVAPLPLVMNLAVIEHVGTVLQRFPAAEVVQLSIARGAVMSDGHRLAALNPVYVVSVPA